MAWLLLALWGCSRPDPGGTGTDPGADGPPRNLVVVSIDTTRRDFVDRYATDGVSRTPVLDGLLERAVVLDRHQQCANWTVGAMHCTLTGVYPADSPFMPRLSPGVVPFPPGQQTLATMLQDHGFRTVLSTANGFFSSMYNGAQGYAVEEFHFTVSASRVADLGVAALEAEIAAAPDARWFLHLHFFEPHAPYDAPQEWLGDTSGLPPVAWNMETAIGQDQASEAYATETPEVQEAIRLWMQAVYGAELRYVDDQLGAVWSDLEGRGLLDDAVVVLFTDHGEAFWEHGARGHGLVLGEQEAGGVAALWAPGLAPAAWTERTTAVDLVPTVLDQLGLPIPDGLSGHVLGTAPADRVLYAETSAYLGPVQTVITADRKLQYAWAGPLLLTDPVNDPGDLVDLAAAEPDTVAALWALLEPRTAQMQALLPEYTPTPP